MRLLKWPQEQQGQQHIAFGQVLGHGGRFLHGGRAVLLLQGSSTKTFFSHQNLPLTNSRFQVFYQVTAGQDRGTCGILPHCGSAAGLTHCTVLCSRFDCHFKLTEDPRPLTSRRRQSSSMKIFFVHNQTLSNSLKPDLCLGGSPRKASVN